MEIGRREKTDEKKILFDNFDNFLTKLQLQSSNGQTRFRGILLLDNKRKTRNVVRFRMWMRAFEAKSSCEFQSFSFVPEFNQWGRVKEGRGADESNAEFSVKLFQNQIVDSYGNTQDVKISRKLNSKSFHLLFSSQGLQSMNERGVFEVWFKQKFALIDFQEEILFLHEKFRDLSVVLQRSGIDYR